MRRFLIVVALLFVNPLWRVDYENGVAAYSRKDFAIALDKFWSAAQQGIAEEQSSLCFMYERGEGTEQENTKAIINALMFYRSYNLLAEVILEALRK